MGIILLSLAILPLLGVGGMQLFKAEVPGPSPDKLTPRIKHTAELLWGVYVLISLVEMILLKIAGMNWFDAACHTFGTMATGGFSTKNSSIGSFQNPWIDWIIILFMIIAGINFALHYRALRGKPFYYWKDPETRFFIFIIIAASLIIGIDVWSNTGDNLFISATDTVFQVVSIITTTGYGSADYELWAYSSQIILFILMFIGGCAGSTGGGMKVIRSIVLLQTSRHELKKLLHPQAVFTVRVGETVVPEEIRMNISGFFLLYITIFVFGIIVMSLLGSDIETAFGSVAATLNNIGPGIGSVGPTDNYAHVPVLGKWFLSFLMLIGRLEVYTVIILFTFTFWKK
jgi:trk system potassium uptake protein TrkH